MKVNINKFLFFLKNLFKKGNYKNVLGIDIGVSSIKFVQLKRKHGRAVLEAYGERSLLPYLEKNSVDHPDADVSQISQALIDLLQEHNATSKVCAISIPIISSLISFIKLPNINPNQLAKSIPLEARKYIPVPLSEVSMDYLIIPEENSLSEYQKNKEVIPKKDIDVLLTVIHNNVLDRNREIAKITKLEFSFSEIEIFSSMRVVLDSSIEPQMIIDFGSNYTTVYIAEKGILRASHLINRGSRDITFAISKSLNISLEEAEEIKKSQGLSKKDGAKITAIAVASITLDYIFSEASAVMINYQKKTGHNITKVIFTGGGSILKGLSEKAQSFFGLKVIIADPFSKIEYPVLFAEALKKTGPVFAVAVGLALRQLQDE